MRQYKRVWVYCRTAYPDAEALERQKQMLLHAADKQGFQVVGITAESGSGLSLERQGIKELLTAVDNKQMDIVFVKDASRIARNFIELWNCVERLETHGIEVLTLDDGFLEKPWANPYMQIAKARKHFVGLPQIN